MASERQMAHYIGDSCPGGHHDDRTCTADSFTPHLDHHLTDGRWHDDCRWCLRRRIWGGNGTAIPLRARYSKEAKLPGGVL